MTPRARRLTLGAVIAFAALTAWLLVPILIEPSGGPVDECERCLELARLAPPDADEVMIVPPGGSLWFSMPRHPIREDRIFGGVVRGAMLALATGRNPVVLWRLGNQVGAAISASPPRRLLLRVALPPVARGQVSTIDGALIVGKTPGGFPNSALVAISREPGQLFVAHRNKPSIPGVVAPAFSSLAFHPNSLSIISRMRDVPPASALLPRELRHPKSAVLSVALGSVAALTGEWERLLPVDSTGMGEGLVAIYGVDAGAFLPRVRGVIVARSTETDPVVLLDRLVPAVDGSVSSVRSRDGISIARREAMGLVGEAALIDGRAILALDATSMDSFLDDRAEAASVAEGTEWSLRAKPTELRSAIRSASDSLGYKLLGKRTRNSVKALGRALGWLEGARSATVERTRQGAEARVTCTIEW